MDAGSVVKIKSGGPKMTIKFVENNEAWCQWFDGVKVMEGSFALTSLESADEAKTKPPSK